MKLCVSIIAIVVVSMISTIEAEACFCPACPNQQACNCPACPNEKTCYCAPCPNQQACNCPACPSRRLEAESAAGRRDGIGCKGIFCNRRQDSENAARRQDALNAARRSEFTGRK